MANKILTGTNFLNNRNTSHQPLLYQDTDLFNRIISIISSILCETKYIE